MSDIINSFPGYEFVDGKNMYRGEDVGRGGYVYSEPGCYANVALLDIASMHPHSIIALNLFGEYTPRFKELMDARIYIKHHDFESAKNLPTIGPKIAPFLDDESQADALAKALKIAINSVYGLTAASFDNPFRDIRNKNNIVALRGALFMVNLKHEVQRRGFTVVHIKTDSIKIANATPEIISFCMDYAKLYGYTFEHEATYDRICLIDKAQYIAKYSDDASINGKHAGQWTATGAAFQHPYIFKTLFSHEEIEFYDLCETKEVKTAIYLDMNEKLPEGEHNYIFVGRVGEFVPILPGRGGGILVRENGEKYDAVVGTKGRRWLESELVKSLGKEGDIDLGYFRALVDDAKDTIRKYDDFDNFVSEGSYEPLPFYSDMEAKP